MKILTNGEYYEMKAMLESYKDVVSMMYGCMEENNVLRNKVDELSAKVAKLAESRSRKPKKEAE